MTMTYTKDTLRGMTQNKNSNDHDKYNHESRDESISDSHYNDSWESFVEAHSEDLSDIESSLTAKRFEHHAKRKSKKAVFKASALNESAFTTKKSSAKSSTERGPRDFSSNWLDTDFIMDQESQFTPHQLHFEKPSTPVIIYSISTLAGILGLIGILFIPRISSFSSFVGSASMLCLLIGIGGLINTRRDFHQRIDPGDDGARV
jgi:hypothetical protein